MVVSKGKAKGKIKLLLRREEIAKIKKGDILVAPQDTPWYMPELKKAGGVITDGGGMTCHAAIVSRELGIPCVISTKIATKVLRDGQIVEVDADKGVVKIIK